MNKRTVGRQQEELAVEELKRRGYQILERNYQIRSGEIDIIAYDAPYLVFVEVKYRKNLSMGYAQEAVDARKQKKLIQTAKYYLLTHGKWQEQPCRFDVVAMNGVQIEVIQNAFYIQ